MKIYLIVQIDPNTGYVSFVSCKPCSTVEDALFMCAEMGKQSLSSIYTFVEANIMDSMKE